MKFGIGVFFEDLLRKLRFHSIVTKITGTLREYLRTSLITSRSVLLRIRIVAGKICTGNQNTRFVFSNSGIPKIVPFVS
jgi:hypothetical protein